MSRLKFQSVVIDPPSQISIHVENQEKTQKHMQKRVTQVSPKTEVSIAHDRSVHSSDMIEELSESDSLEKAEIEKFRKEKQEFLRLNNQPLQFGVEERLVYTGHQTDTLGFVQNFNNNMNLTWSQKELHFWCAKTGKRNGALKIIDITKAHTTITSIIFTHKYRLYIISTADFKLIFLNELFKVV